MARDCRRQLDSAKTFTANSPVSFDLPRDSVYKEIVLMLEFLATTGVGEALSGPFEGAPWTLIKRIDLIADGKDTIKSYDGAFLTDLNYFDFGTYPPIHGLALGASANTDTQIMALVMSMESIGMQRPQNTWLDSRHHSSLELRITFGAGLADVYATVTGAPVLNTYRLTPFGHEIYDIAKESTFSMNQEAATQFPFETNTGTKKRWKLNTGNAYRRILLSTRDSNVRAVVDRFTRLAIFEQGSFYRRDLPSAFWKNLNALKFAPGNHGIGNAPTGAPAVSTTGQDGGFRNGLYLLDFAEDGSINALVDTFGYSSFELEGDWDGANTTDLIRILPTIIVPSIR